jgi:hypothetical protein
MGSSTSLPPDVPVGGEAWVLAVLDVSAILVSNVLIIWGICFPLEANSNVMKTYDPCTVRALHPTASLQ